MKKILAIIGLCLMWSSNLLANNPMWEIANDWICKPKLHSKINMNGTVEGINEIAITQTIDFKNSKVVSSSGNSIGKIIDKAHIINPGRYIENILIIDWKGWGKYTSVITHNLEKDEFWKSKSSGMGRGTIYTAISKCDPL